MPCKHIMVAIDLEHADRMGMAIMTGRTLARQFDPRLAFGGVTSEVPGPIALNPPQLQKKMAVFAETGDTDRFEGASAKTSIAHDPTAQTNSFFFDAVKAIGAQLVMMASQAEIADVVVH